MIRRLRTVHRLAWPVFAVLLAGLLTLAAQRTPTNTVQRLLVEAASESVVIIGQAAFRISIERNDNRNILTAGIVDPARATTGLITLMQMDANGEAVRALGSLAAARRGLMLPEDVSLPLTIGFYDVVAAQWHTPITLTGSGN